MATINTRLKLKYDSYENWMEHDPILLAGEVAFAAVTVAQDGKVNEVPSVLMKVGDGEKKYSELDFVYAKAADVIAAAKSEDSMTAFINNVIANAGIATDEAMQALTGRVSTAEGKITTLETQMGGKSVATQISEAITALNIADYAKKTEVEAVQTALNEYKTSNDAAVQQNATDIAGEISRAKAAEEANANAITAIKDGTTIDSFKDVEDALAGKETAGAAATAEQNAKDYADGLAGNYDAAGSAAAVDGKLTAEVERATAAEEKALKDAKDYTDAEIAEWVGTTTVAAQITAGVANKSDKGHTHTKSEITDFAHTHEMSEVNGLEAALEGKQAVGDYATKAEAQGYADAKDAAIEAAQAAADKAQEEVDALEGVVGALPEGEESVIKYIEKKTAGIATDAALAELQGDVDALEELVGTTSVATQISTAVNAEKERAEGIEADLEERLAAVEADHLVAEDKADLEEAIAAAEESAVDRVLGYLADEEVNADFDTLKEVAAWIESDTTASAQLVTRVSTIEEDYLKAADKKELSDAIGANTTEIAKKAAQADFEALEGRVETAEGEIDTLQSEMDAVEEKAAANESAISELNTKVGTDSVATQISSAINGLNIDQYATDSDVEALTEELGEVEGRVATLEGEMDAAEGKIGNLETEVAKKANSADLAAVATSGNIADLIQTAGEYIVFDCGSASVNI